MIRQTLKECGIREGIEIGAKKNTLLQNIRGLLENGFPWKLLKNP